MACSFRLSCLVVLLGVLAITPPFTLCSPAGSLCLTHSPPSMYSPETSTTNLPLHQFGPLLAYTTGLSAQQPNGWMGKVDALNRPKAMLLMAVGVNGVDENGVLDGEWCSASGARRFDLVKGDDVEVDDGEAVERSVHSFVALLESRWPTATLVQVTPDGIQSLNADRLEDVPLGKSDKENTLAAGVGRYMEQLRAWLQRGGPNAHSAAEGPAGPHVYLVQVDKPVHADDFDVLLKHFTDLTAAVDKLYAGDFVSLVAAYEQLAPSENRRRAKRQADQKAADQKDEPKELTADDFRSEDEGAVFAIVLLVAITIGLLVFFVATGMWFMEPGKDTIIYRMSMTRIKRD